MQRESDYAVPKGGECQREPALIAFRLAAAHGRLGLTEIQAAAAAGRERAALGSVRAGAGGGLAEDAQIIVKARRSKSRGGPGRGDDERDFMCGAAKD